MTELKHSPLPWTVLACGTHIVDPCAWTVASTHFGGDADQSEANARLIIAAVNSHADLLAAAKNMLSAIATRDIGSFTWESRAAKDLQAAIRKAEQA